MSQRPRVIFPGLSFFVLFLIASAVPALAQDSTSFPHIVHIIGLEKVKHNAKGQLSVTSANLEFSSGGQKEGVPIGKIADVFTGDDSRRVIGGTLGTLSMFAPYGSGRFLSLFRKKVDVLTLEYRDVGGGLHGLIFVLPAGEAAAVKKQLIARGAHASIPVEEQEQGEKKDSRKKVEQKP